MTAPVRLSILTTCLAVASGLFASGSFAAEFPGLGPKGDLVRVEFENSPVTKLQGKNARRQLLVTGIYSSGQRHDLTHEVQYSVDRADVISVSPTGVVTPLADGNSTILAKTADGKVTTTAITVEKCSEDPPINFEDEIVPIFTKLGCNAGGCHGKSDGQNGFKLSLLGFYPEDDYEYLVYEDRGRRIFPGDPEQSLLLAKPSNRIPHGGGQRLVPGSYEWNLVSRWIEQGMPYGSDADPKLVRIESLPASRTMNFASQQQISVLAHYSDGSIRDVTQLAQYEPNHPEMASAAASGRVATADMPGDIGVMVRFQDQVNVFRAIVPQGLPVANLPPQKNLVDEHVFAKLVELGIPPSPLCDDATFIRRSTIDITGRLPTVQETEAFLADADPAKRDRLVDRLVDSPEYAEAFANLWSAVLRNKRRNGNDVPYTYRFHAWIRRSLQENVPYDQFVRSVLTATGDPETHPPVAWYREVSTTTAQLEDTAQLFLGMRLACAKCHHHPFEQWSQKDYYSFEAFFTQVEMKSSKFNPQANMRDAVSVKAISPQSTDPRSGEKLPPAGLGAEPLDVPPYEDARHELVDWMTSPENPYFAKALVNRYWKRFFGRGIVDPEDDLRVTNPPSNPALLDALAKSFVESGYDLKQLVRLLAKSNAYQLSSVPTEANANDKRNFSSFYPRRLAAEVLYDAINQTAEAEANFGGAIPQGTRAVALPDNGFDNYFFQVFGKPEAESACECERSAEANLSQSLHLLNSSDVQGRLQNGEGRALRLSQETERDLDAKIRELYLAAFSRTPTTEEAQFVRDKVASYTDQRQAWEDVLWALLNSKEFQFVR